MVDRIEVVSLLQWTHREKIPELNEMLRKDRIGAVALGKRIVIALKEKENMNYGDMVRLERLARKIASVEPVDPLEKYKEDVKSVLKKLDCFGSPDEIACFVGALRAYETEKLNEKVLDFKYPWVTVEMTQAEGKYEVYIALAEGVHFSVMLDDKGLTNLDDSIKCLREFLKEVSKGGGK